jgi:hypothetical protein
VLVVAKIYESPDGGDTVYSREPGSADRVVVREGTLRQMQRRSQLWRDIFLQARTDAELQRLIEQVEIFYRLRYTNPNE